MSFGLLFCAACSGTNGSTDGSGASSTGGSSGGVPVNLDGGGVPATPPDGVAACPKGTCNYQADTGCSGAMSSCLPTLSEGSVVPACQTPGTVPSGGTCVAPTDCVAGHLCVQGTCKKLCCGGDWTGCDSPSEHCLLTLEYASDAGILNTGVMLCAPVDGCDALTPSSCTQAGASCQIADPTGATACVPEGTGSAGQPCPCKGGFTCVTPAGTTTSVCVRLCKAVVGGGAPYCQSNEGICTHYTRDPPGVGECQPPQ